MNDKGKGTINVLWLQKNGKKYKRHNYTKQSVVMSFIGKKTSMLSKTFSYAV